MMSQPLEPEPSPAQPTHPAPGATGRVSMAMVAARAGVSGQTVSRVVNGSPRVDPATRARIEDAMAALGYRPHRAARALRTGRSQTIGLIVTTLTTIGNSRMLQATAEAAAERGYALTLVTAAHGIAAAFDSLIAQEVDGAIVLNEASAQVAAATLPPDLRLVIVDAPKAANTTSVHSDHAGGSFTATTHLLQRGYPVVHHLAGPTDSFAANERERGWREALLQAGIGAPEPVRGNWSAESGYSAGALLSGAPAVFCANDQMALGLLRSFANQGRRVPEQVGVVGFDDVPDAANYQPPLTTIRQDFTALAHRAVQALVADIEGTSTTWSTTVIPTTLIDRDSTR